MRKYLHRPEQKKNIKRLIVFLSAHIFLMQPAFGELPWNDSANFGNLSLFPDLNENLSGIFTEDGTKVAPKDVLYPLFDNNY